MSTSLSDLRDRVRAAFIKGQPNGWLSGWATDRHFSQFAQLVSPYMAVNVTSFDYAACNRFEVRTTVLPDGRYATLSVLLSFLADMYVLHWTIYDVDGTTGHVLGAPPSVDDENLQQMVERWLANLAFTRMPDDWYNTEIDVHLELSGDRHVTLGKCLFQDFDG